MTRKRIVLAFIVISMFACASSWDESGENIKDSLPYDVRETVGENDGKFTDKLRALLDIAMETAKNEIGKALDPAVKTAAIAFIASAAASFGAAGEVCGTVGAFSVLIVSMGAVNSLVSDGISTINTLSDVSKLLMPTLAAMTAACGGVAQSTVKYFTFALINDILVTAANKIICPLICAYTVVKSSAQALDSDGLNTAADVLKWISVTVMTAAAACFTACLSITGIMAKSTDEAAVKMAKAAVSASLPIVGGIIADASSSVIGAASAAKASLGAFGLITMAVTLTAPFVRLSVNGIACAAAARAAQTLCPKRVGGAAAAIKTSMNMIMGLYGVCATVSFVSAVSMMRAVTGT